MATEIEFKQAGEVVLRLGELNTKESVAKAQEIKTKVRAVQDAMVAHSRAIEAFRGQQIMEKEAMKLFIDALSAVPIVVTALDPRLASKLPTKTGFEEVEHVVYASEIIDVLEGSKRTLVLAEALANAMERQQHAHRQVKELDTHRDKTSQALDQVKSELHVAVHQGRMVINKLAPKPVQRRSPKPAQATRAGKAAPTAPAPAAPAPAASAAPAPAAPAPVVQLAPAAQPAGTVKVASAPAA